MNTSRRAATVAAAPRALAIAAGVCYLLTHVTSVAAPFLYGPVLHDAGYIVGPGPDTRVLWGGFLETICVLTIVGTAVALYPVVRRHHEGLAMGYVGLRTLEAAIIAAGIVPLLAVVTLRQQAGAAGAAALVPLGHALVAAHNWTFILGPGLTCGVNTVVLASLLYRSGLVPRIIPALGLVGGPLVFAYNTAVMFGVHPPAWAGLAVIPIFAWEVSLALRLIARGFNSPAIVVAAPRAAAHEPTPQLLGAD